MVNDLTRRRNISYNDCRCQLILLVWQKLTHHLLRPNVQIKAFSEAFSNGVGNVYFIWESKGYIITLGFVEDSRCPRFGMNRDFDPPLEYGTLPSGVSCAGINWLESTADLTTSTLTSILFPIPKTCETITCVL